MRKKLLIAHSRPPGDRTLGHGIRAHSTSLLTLCFCILAYIVLFTALVLWKFNHFYYDNLDLAIFTNVFFNTLNGVPFAATIHPPSYLGDHFSPIILLLVPLYALYRGPQTLLIVQTLIIGLTALPIFLIARHMLKKSSPWLSLFIALLWLVNPIVHNMNFFEFELLPFAIFFIVWTLYFYLTTEKTPFIIFVLLALLTREDIAFTIAIIAVLAFIDKRPQFWKWFPVATAFIYSTVSFPVIEHFNSASTYKFLVFYGWLGGTSVPSIVASFFLHPVQLLKHQLTVTNLEFVLGLTFPFFFMVITRSKYLFLLVPQLASVWLSAQGGSALLIMTHYGGYFLFYLFLVFIQQVRNLESGAWARFVPHIFRDKRVLYLVIATASLYGAITYGSIVPAVAAWRDDNQHEAKRELLRLIPARAPVAATFELLTPLSARSKIYSLHYALVQKNQFALTDYALPPDTEYLAIDWNDMVKTEMHFDEHHSFGPYADRVSETLKRILQNFELISADGSLTLWQRADDPGATTEKIVLLESLDRPSPRHEPILQEAIADEQGIVLTVLLPNTPVRDRHYYMEVETPQRTFMIPLGYGLYAQPEWTSVMVHSLFVPPEEQAGTTIRLYGWDRAFLKLGGLKNLEVVAEPQLVDALTL